MNDQGKEVASISKYIGEVTNNWVKIWTLVEGLQLCKLLNIKNLEIEGDFAIVINTLTKGSLSN